MERYGRHSLIDWFSQDAIAGAKAIVIGAGAVGNEVIKNLALLGVGEIAIYDLDRIELHNLTRSVLFRESDVGAWKAEVAAERARQLDPNIKVSAHRGDFWTELSIRDLRTFDVVFCCVDNFEARIRSNTLCILAGVDLINLGIDSRFAVVESFRFSLASDAACYECGLPDSVYQRMAQRFSCGHLRKVSFVERKIPTTIITSGAAASIGVSAGLRLGSQDDSASTRILIDTIAGTSTRTELVRNPMCPACGRLPAAGDILRCGRGIGSLEVFESDRPVTVTLSEPVLVGHRIGDAWVDVFKRASDFDDGYAGQISPDPDAVHIEIRDQFDLVELIERYSAFSIPTKFAIVEDGERVAVFEFEGDDDVRGEDCATDSRPDPEG